MKYTFDISERKVYCVTHYAGEPVRGVSKCNLDYDLFDCEVGINLARLRCDKKVAIKKIANLERKLKDAEFVLAKDITNVENLKRLLNKAKSELTSISAELSATENKLKD